MAQTNSPSAVLGAKRLLNASAREVFAAFQRPELLAKWWGPNGFTNTFETFEFRPGGRWKFVMHAPPGKNGEPGANYPNENVFREIVPESRIVIEHVCPPWFTLTITLTPQGDQTQLDWAQEFENPEVAQKILALIGNANEENLDRMERVLGESKS